MQGQEIIGLASSTQAGKLSSAQYSALVNLLAASSASHKWIASIGADGTIHLSQPATADLSDAGQANGCATLNSSGQLNSAQIPTALVGSVVYVSGWNASTNSPALASGVGTKGNYYVVTTPGTTSLDGNASWGVGDVLLFNGSVWEQLKAPSNQVVSFNGRTGAVTPQAADYSADFAPLAGGSSIVTVGVVTAGTWHATAIAAAYIGSLPASQITSGTFAVGLLPVLGASGSGHAAGIVPDPGASAGTTRFLREDATWATPSGGGGGSSAGTAGQVQYADGSGGFLADNSTLDGSGNWSGKSVTVSPSSGNAWDSPNATIDYQGNANFDAMQVTSLLVTSPTGHSGSMVFADSGNVGFDSAITTDGSGNVHVASLQNANGSFTVDASGNMSVLNLTVDGQSLQTIATAGISGTAANLVYCDGVGGATGASNTSLQSNGALSVASINVPSCLADGTYSIAGGAGSITITNGLISAVS